MQRMSQNSNFAKTLFSAKICYQPYYDASFWGEKKKKKEREEGKDKPFYSKE